MTTRPLPDLPGSLTLDEARAVVAAFGWQLLIAPADAPRTPPGFGFVPAGANVLNVTGANIPVTLPGGTR